MNMLARAFSASREKPSGMCVFPILSFAFVFAGCSPSQPQVVVDQGTPADTWASYEKAVSVREYHTMLQCIHPSQRARYSQYYSLAKAYNEELARLEGSISRKIGRAEADEFRNAVRNGVFGAPQREPECKYNILSTHVEGGKAILSIAEKHGRGGAHVLVMHLERRDDGKWYVLDYTNGIPTTDGMALYKECVEASRRGVQDGIRMVEEGSVTKDNYASFLSTCTGILK